MRTAATSTWRQELGPPEGRPHPSLLCVTGGYRGVQFFDLDSGEKVWTMRSRGGSTVHLCRFREQDSIIQGETIGCGSEIAFYSLTRRRKKRIHGLIGHHSSISCLELIPSFFGPPRFLSSGSFDATVRIWDLSDESMKSTFVGHRDEVSCLSFISTRDWLCSGSEDHSLRFWDLFRQSAMPEKTIRHDDVVSSVRFLGETSQRGSLVVSSSWDGTIRCSALGETRDGGRICIRNQYGVFALCPHPLDSNLVVSGDGDGVLSVWDLRSAGRPLRSHRLHKPGCPVIDIVAIGDSHFASCTLSSRDSTVAIWTDDLEDSCVRMLFETEGRNSGMCCLAPIQ